MSRKIERFLTSNPIVIVMFTLLGCLVFLYIQDPVSTSQAINNIFLGVIFTKKSLVMICWAMVFSLMLSAFVAFMAHREQKRERKNKDTSS